jgi:hypothetical protein
MYMDGIFRDMTMNFQIQARKGREFFDHKRSSVSEKGL